MSAPTRGFDRLASWYRALEVLAFGGDLERARFRYLPRLADRRDILLLGEGDGRCAERLAAAAPQARILCVDSSPGMIERAARRVARAGASDRVSFLCADAVTYTPEAGRHDAVTTLFFLDCFDGATASGIVSRVSAALRPDALWVFADFVLPEGRLARLRARAWLGILYVFFRWETGLRVSELPPSEAILEREGWRRVEAADLQCGLVRSVLLARGATGATGALSASASPATRASR